MCEPASLYIQLPFFSKVENLFFQMSRISHRSMDWRYLQTLLRSVFLSSSFLKEQPENSSMLSSLSCFHIAHYITNISRKQQCPPLYVHGFANVCFIGQSPNLNSLLYILEPWYFNKVRSKLLSSWIPLKELVSLMCKHCFLLYERIE